jgi:hypothetical protein
VNLAGWRFSDQPSFARAYTITNDLVLEPGESAIFAERLDEALFVEWWGRDHLPPNFKLCTYTGFGLGYLGEQLILWNPAATDPNDSFASVLWAAATLGVSFECERWCDPTGEWCEDEATVESVAGVRGAFRAANGMDIGSPGYVANPALRILSVGHSTTNPREVTLTCRVIPNRSYRLWRASSPLASSWEPRPTRTAISNTLVLRDELPDGSADRFYRVEELP